MCWNWFSVDAPLDVQGPWVYSDTELDMIISWAIMYSNCNIFFCIETVSLAMWYSLFFPYGEMTQCGHPLVCLHKSTTHRLTHTQTAQILYPWPLTQEGKMFQNLHTWHQTPFSESNFHVRSPNMLYQKRGTIVGNTDNAILLEINRVNILHLIWFNFVGNWQHKNNMK